MQNLQFHGDLKTVYNNKNYIYANTDNVEENEALHLGTLTAALNGWSD